MKYSDNAYALDAIIRVSIVWPSPVRARAYSAIVTAAATTSAALKSGLASLHCVRRRDHHASSSSESSTSGPGAPSPPDCAKAPPQIAPAVTWNAGFARHRSGRAVGRGVDVDQRGVERAQRRVVDAESLGNARPVVVDQRVGSSDQAVHDVASLGGLEVERDALLALHALQAHGAVAAQRVAFERFDLDHPSAELGQQRGGHGRGDPGSQLEDGDAL